MDDYDDFGGGGCCPSCCRAPDLGVHDYCLPCATNPTCTRAFQRPVRQTDLEPLSRLPVRFITAEAEARNAAQKQRDDDEEKKKKRHDDDKKNKKKSHDDEKNEKCYDDEKQKSQNPKHHEGRGKKNKESAKAGDDEKPMGRYSK
ncbi:Uncharacterized protein TCAP_03944 [Tolypocladium capitatum]|uniref:Uncharacterized protein n=1 Tax=Tolypocladium capitatum TaxID=45235 RepID=A0A2K3QF23_9HYPO|nr:Uncharacterized protein TCAP_03944 [Tolypocladium capitatum]